jgi:hypothetical protein
MKRRVGLGIVVGAVMLGILLKRSSAPRHRYGSSASETAGMKADAANRSTSAATRNFPAELAVSATALTLSQNQEPGVSASHSTSHEPLPDGLSASIRSNFEGYRVPEGKDITSGWTVDKGPGAFSFLCLGDFNGDGAEDAAIILIGEEGWKFVIFEKDGPGQYRPAFVARPKNKEELGKGWEEEILAAPQHLLLRTVKKGETWAPEADDDPNLGPMKSDAIEIVAKPIPNAYFSSLILFKDGKYQQVYREPLVAVPVH